MLKRIAQLALTGLSATMLAAPSGAQEQADGQDAYTEFGAFLDNYRREHGTPALSAVIVRNGAIAWEGYFGTYDDEGDFPNNADTTFKIASVTKPLAATAILAESLAGQLDLDAPMTSDAGWAGTCEWLSSSPITFGSGGTDAHGNIIPAMDCSQPLTIGGMLDMRANGDAFVYNPVSFARLDRVIEGSGGRPLRAIVRDRVAEPADMRDTALGWRDPEQGAALRFLAEPFYYDGQTTEKQPLPDDDFRAAAGIIASPRAIAAFDIAYDAGLLLPPSYRQGLVDLEIGPLGDYRQGWFLEDWEGQRLMWHSGWNERQYSALYLKVPERNLTLIVLANTEAIWWDSSLVQAEVVRSPIARRFLETFAR